MDWKKTSREPIPRQIVIKRMRNDGIPESTVKASLSVLQKEGYIRKAITVRHAVSYVILRTITEPVVSCSPSYEEAV